MADCYPGFALMIFYFQHCSKKDRAISDLRHVVKGLEAQKKELSARCEGVEEELEVLRLEVRERDRILANNQEEMNLLNEQLTEVRGVKGKRGFWEGVDMFLNIW